MAEQKLREFLAGNNDTSVSIPFRSRLFSKNSKEHSVKNNEGPVSKGEVRRDPIALQMQVLDAEIEQQIQEEIKIEREKNHSPHHSSPSTKSPMNRLKNLEEQVADANEPPKGVLLNEKMISKLDRTISKRAVQSQPRGRTRDIINEILDQGRLEFLYSYRNRSRPRKHKNYTKSVTARVVYTGGGSNAAETHQRFFQSNSKEQTLGRRFENARLGAVLPEIGHHHNNMKNWRQQQQTNASIRTEFSQCKEYRRMKSSGDLSSGIVIKRGGEKMGDEKRGEKALGGTVTSHLGTQPLRYQFNTAAATKGHAGTLGKLLGNVGKKGNSVQEGFLRNVESQVLNMKQVWHADHNNC